MKKKQFVRDFDYYIDEYMYNCRSRKLRPKTMQSYEQTLRLFERWCLEEANITAPGQVLDSTIRHGESIPSMQQRTVPLPITLQGAEISRRPSAQQRSIIISAI